MRHDLADVRKAKMYFEIAHYGQKYSDEIPYTYHLEMVVRVLERFGFTDNIITCAGYGHDAIEDSNTSYNDIKERFGEEVAELVYAVTSELGRNRKERNHKTYGKIKQRFYPTALKLADRIANVEFGSANGGKRDMYVKEYKEFYMSLYHGGGNDGPWYVEHACDIQPAESDKRVERMWQHLHLLLGDPFAGDKA